MDRSLPALILASHLDGDAMMVVDAVAALRLARQGYRPVPSAQASWRLRQPDRRLIADARCFVTATRLSSFPVSSLADGDVLAVVLAAVRRGDLVAVTDDAGGATTSATAELRRLVRAITQKTGGRLQHGGRRYLLVVDVDLSRVPARDSYEVVGRAEAHAVLDALAARPDTSPDLASLFRDAVDRLSADWRPPLMPDGLVLLRRLITVTPSDAPSTPLSPSQLAQQLPIHWVELRFRDAGGRPVVGCPYTITLPDGSEQRGKLDGAGKARYEGQPGGAARLVLADVEAAEWEAGETEADVPVALTVATRGIDPGTAVRFDIFRLYRERDDAVVATLDGTVDDAGRAIASWRPESIDDPEDAFVFKATAAGAWKKSPALKVVREVSAATWGASPARPGDSVTLRAHIQGVKDGETATFTVFEKLWRGLEDPTAAELDGSVDDGNAEVSWTVPAETEAPAAGDDGLRYYFFVAEAGGVLATSDLLVVEAAGQSTPAEGAEEP